MKGAHLNAHSNITAFRINEEINERLYKLISAMAIVTLLVIGATIASPYSLTEVSSVFTFEFYYGALLISSFVCVTLGIQGLPVSTDTKVKWAALCLLSCAAIFTLSHLFWQSCDYPPVGPLLSAHTAYGAMTSVLVILVTTATNRFFSRERGQQAAIQLAIDIADRASIGGEGDPTVYASLSPPLSYPASTIPTPRSEDGKRSKFSPPSSPVPSPSRSAPSFPSPPFISSSRRRVLPDEVERTVLNCVLYNAIHTLEQLLQHPTHKDVINVFDPNPLLTAIRKGYEDIAVLLVENGARVDSTEYILETPLIAAAKRGCSILVAKLISQGADVQRTDTKGFSPLVCAILAPKNNRFIIEIILKSLRSENGISPLNQPLKIEGKEMLLTPLQLALSHGVSVETLECILQLGAAVDVEALYIALEGRANIIEYHPRARESLITEYHPHARESLGDVEQTDKQLEAELKLEMDEVLHWLCRRACEADLHVALVGALSLQSEDAVAGVQILLTHLREYSSPVNLNASLDNGKGQAYEPLEWAVREGADEAVVKYLLSCGAKPDHWIDDFMKEHNMPLDPHDKHFLAKSALHERRARLTGLLMPPPSPTLSSSSSSSTWAV